MDSTHKEYLKLAINIAIENVKSGGGPFGAVIVRNGEIVATSGNSVSADNDPTAHAEVNAIRKASKILQNFDLSDCILYASCEPCPMCLGAIYWARIKTLFYAATRFDAHNAGFSDADIYHEINEPIESRSIKTVNIKLDEAGKPFETWFNSENKTLY